MYKNLVEKQTGHKIKCVQSDRGRQYINKEFDLFITDQGIDRRLGRCLLIKSGLSPSFWSDAIAMACYIRNRCPFSSVGGLIPYEKWTGTAPDLSNLRIFGDEVHVLDKDPSKNKFGPRSMKGIFIGYSRESKGYRVWMLNKRKTIVNRDVKFLDKSRVDLTNDLDILEILTP